VASSSTSRTCPSPAICYTRPSSMTISPSRLSNVPKPKSPCCLIRDNGIRSW
jgi:hypothetical protein